MVYAYEVLASAIEAELGGDPAFGLIGDANMHCMSVLHGRGRTRFIGVNHEVAAVSAADGFAAASGRVGFATTTCGPGLTQVATSLVAAARNRSPLVLLAGDTGRAEIDHVQRFDQVTFASACEAEVIDVRSVDSLLPLVRRAFYRARTQEHPVVLNVPLDVQLEESDWWPQYQPTALRPVGRERPDPDVVARACDQLAAAKRPVLIAGRGAVRSTSPEAIERLAHRIGALVATTLPAHGWLDQDPFSIGVAGTFGSTIAQELFADADLVISIGASLSSYTTQSGLLFPDAVMIRVDTRLPDKPPLPDQSFVEGDADAVISALLGALGPPPRGEHGYRTAAIRARLDEARQLQYETPDSVSGLDPRAVMKAIGPHVPNDAVFVCGAGHFWSFPIQYMSLPTSVPFFGSYTFGAIGQTLAFSIGVAAALHRPVFTFDGDGGTLMNIQEIDTFVREGFPIKLFVINDRSFGAEMQRMVAWGLDDDLARFRRPSFSALARAFGAGGSDIQALHDVPDAVDDAVAHDGPFVIDVHVSDQVMSEPFQTLIGDEPSPIPLVTRRPV